LKRKAEKLGALIDAVNRLNNDEVQMPEEGEDTSGSEKGSSGADADVDDEDPDLE